MFNKDRRLARQVREALESHLGHTYLVSYRHNPSAGLMGRLVAIDLAFHTFADCLHVADGVQVRSDTQLVLVPNDVIESMGIVQPTIAIAGGKAVN